LRKRSDRTKKLDLPLFPGYVFCCFDANKRLPILTTPGVVKVVGPSGTEGTLLKVKDELRLVTSITLLQRSMAVVIDQDSLRPLFDTPGNFHGHGYCRAAS
jgi:hypothetical protein